MCDTKSFHTNHMSYRAQPPGWHVPTEHELIRGVSHQTHGKYLDSSETMKCLIMRTGINMHPVSHARTRLPAVGMTPGDNASVCVGVMGFARFGRRENTE